MTPTSTILIGDVREQLRSLPAGGWVNKAPKTKRIKRSKREKLLF